MALEHLSYDLLISLVDQFVDCRALNCVKGTITDLLEFSNLEPELSHIEEKKRAKMVDYIRPEKL